MVKALDINYLTDTAYVLKTEKPFDFKPGQFANVGVDGIMRELTIYNSPKDNHLEFLIKVISKGILSNKLPQYVNKDIVVTGPDGHFIMSDKDLNKEHVFVGTGVGIAPFHSFVKSFDLNYKMIHGVRFAYENYHEDDYEKGKYFLCCSRDKFPQRVTDFIQKEDSNPEAIYWLCGNSDMINDASEILEDRIPLGNIKSEVFF